jgi:phosphopantetheinyl transferase (holo-ACP synthase)
VHLSGRAAERAAELGAEVRVSLTHTRGMAAAVAVVQ